MNKVKFRLIFAAYIVVCSVGITWTIAHGIVTRQPEIWAPGFAGAFAWGALIPMIGEMLGVL